MKHIRSLILAFVLSAWLAPAFAQAPPPVPALPDTERRTSYVISGSTCNCAIGFQLYGDSTDYANWIEVWVNGALIPQSGNWTITSATGSLGTIPRPITNAVLTFTTAQTGTVQIVGAQRPRRTSQFSESRGVAARDMNQVLSSLTAMLRENWDKTNDVTGRAVIAPPGETLAMLPKLANRLSQGACFDSSGNLVPCVSIPSSTIIAGNGITLTGVNPTTIAANLSGSAPIVVTPGNPTQISCPTCNTSPATTAPVLPTRTAAAALDLSAYSVVRTLGYASAGDGGGALFRKTAGNLQDSFVTSGTISNAGTAYTNGTYRNVDFSGGNGSNMRANVTVSGTVVTAVTIVQGGGNGYSVGDVLTTGAANIGGTGSGFTWTVSTVSTPLASFTDSAANKWQYVAEGDIRVRQFGVKADWNGVDATATDDFSAIDAALKFGAIKTTGARIDQGGSGGAFVRLPGNGISKVCSALTVYGTVRFAGESMFNSGLHLCDSGLAATAHFVTLGDPNVQQACFGVGIERMTLSATTSAAANANIGMIFSNCQQQSNTVDQVAVYAGLRNCFRYTNGYGGAANITLRDFFCTLYTASVNDGISIDPGTTTNQYFDRLIVEAGGAGYAGNAVNAVSGNVFINGFHTEGVVTGVNVNLTVSNYQGSLRQATGGTGCTELVKLQASNTLGNFIIGASQKNGCTRLITNGQPGGANFAGDTVKDITCNPGAPCN